jgi:hypothetical protein
MCARCAWRRYLDAKLHGDKVSWTQSQPGTKLPGAKRIISDVLATPARRGQNVRNIVSCDKNNLTLGVVDADQAETCSMTKTGFTKT